MLINVTLFFNSNKWHLTVIGVIMLILEVWMLTEAVLCVKKIKILNSSCL